MTRIVYGVSGEGSGHSSRARVVLEHLVQQGHDVRVVTYDRGLRALQGDFHVHACEGLSIATVDNEVSITKTLTQNVAKLKGGWRMARDVKREAFERFDPEVVFTDFEPVTAWLAKHFRLPLISIDNQHRMRYMDVPIPAELAGAARVTRGVIRSIVPRPDQALVTTFWRGRLRNDRTFLFAPLLRKVVRELEPTDGDHVLVYFTHGFDSALDRLRAEPGQSFHVYGTGRVGQEGNLRFEPPSGDGFLRDLAGCRAVVATAGFTLMTEALHLRKPMLALPMAGQFEQELNGLLLEQGGLGAQARQLDEATLPRFLAHLPAYGPALAEYDSGDESALLAHVDRLTRNGGEGARAAREHRRRSAE
tara:strand:- start:19310 stop:20398 length:1089 start_codon:yes stop_codon:yes gene_type:complete